MGQNTATMKALKGIDKAMGKLDSTFRVIHGQAFLPGHYYSGSGGVVIKVVRRSPSGKTVYITTHSDDDNPFTQTKRVKIDIDGYEYIRYKEKEAAIGVWHETDREAFLRYLNANIGMPVVVI